MQRARYSIRRLYAAPPPLSIALTTVYKYSIVSEILSRSLHNVSALVTCKLCFSLAYPNMEVASPLAFSPATTGAKRGLSCSPDLMDSSGRNLAEAMESSDDVHRAKRRRFGGDVCIDALSERFSSHSPFFPGALHGNKGIFGNNTNVPYLKRLRQGTSSPVQSDLNRVVEEQTAVIETLTREKTDLASSLNSLKADHERTCKENTVLRKAVTIQQERLVQAENQVKAAHEYRDGAEDRIKKLEQVILSLRYHLQTQQSNVRNDFLNHPRPPDVY